VLGKLKIDKPGKIISGTTRNIQRSALKIFLLRLAAAVFSAALFGLLATRSETGFNLGPAFLAGFGFGTAFVGGTGYRILIALWRGQNTPAPASWSGAAATSACATLVALLFFANDPAHATHILCAFGLALNLAYLFVKASCTLAGCCHAIVRCAHLETDLRYLELAATFAVLGLGALLALHDLSLSAIVSLVGHVALRHFSRAKRGRAAFGWPPLRQPGAELAPLHILTLVVLVLSLSQS
jgi:hypothetical protein